MQTESVSQERSCESVLDNLTLKMTQDSSERRQLFPKITAFHLRKLGSSKIVVLLLLLVVVVVVVVVLVLLL